MASLENLRAVVGTPLTPTYKALLHEGLLLGVSEKLSAWVLLSGTPHWAQCILVAPSCQHNGVGTGKVSQALPCIWQVVTMDAWAVDTGHHVLWHPWVWGMAGIPGVH